MFRLESRRLGLGCVARLPIVDHFNWHFMQMTLVSWMEQRYLFPE